MPEEASIVLESGYARYVIGSDGRNLHFIDRQTNKDYCAPGPPSYFAHVKKTGKTYPASSVSASDSRISIGFGESGVSAVIKAEARDRYFTFEVLSVSGQGVEELTFAELALVTEAAPSEQSFVGCVMALNLKTRPPGVPGPANRLQATCYSRLGLEGAKAAIIGCPHNKLRDAMKEVILAAPDLAHSTLGGPWALDSEINKGSYLFNFGGLSEDKVDDWIRLAESFGITQIDFHGGNSFRFGDCRPNPQTYPNGRASLKAVIDKLHTRGIKAGLHTYAFFIDKSCPWVTPVPDLRLAKDAVFTLAKPLSPESGTVTVAESVKDMSATTGFQVRNSVTIQIDSELITYSGLSKDPPYAFTGCTRGACGTKVEAHAAGAKVYHLKQCYGLFAPDGDSTLLTDIAAATADTFNECGFDMIYLDALDGEDVLGGEFGWYYGSKFAFELCKRLERPALMEMSTFHHHLWYVRSRMGAWDHPSRNHKQFIDLHCTVNEGTRRMFLPAHLGWSAVITDPGANITQTERTYPDDIEYLMCKCIGTDSGFSLMGVNPDTLPKLPAVQNLAGIFKRYENLRNAGRTPESMKAKLRVPGDEFTLEQTVDGKPQFRRIQYARHKAETTDGSASWITNNRFGRQPVRVRIEGLMSAGAYDSPDAQVLADFSDPGEFAGNAAEKGVTVGIKSSSDVVKDGAVSGFLSASSTRTNANGAWASVTKTFSPVVSMAGKQAIGVWIYGDGRGEVLNFQIKSPEHITRGIGDHLVRVDFLGWRYFELVEIDGGGALAYSWPYAADYYGVYREPVDYGNVEKLSLWFNNLPRDGKVECYLSPIKALPLVKNTIHNPRVTIGGKTITFPVDIESGCRLEFASMSDCRLYGPNSEFIRDVKPEGEAPVLDTGGNRIEFQCDSTPSKDARAYVTVISLGEALRE